MNKVITFLRESSVARFLIPAGIFLMIFGVIIFIVNTKNQDYIKTEAIVSNVQIAEEAYIDADGNHVEATYDVTVKYTVEGREYIGELGGLSKHNIGDKITIYYNPANPSEITQSKSLILPIVITIGGLAIFVGGIVSGMNAFKRYKKLKEQEKGWENGQ